MRVKLHHVARERQEALRALTDSVNNLYVNRKWLGGYSDKVIGNEGDFFSSNNGSVKSSEAPKKANTVRDVDGGLLIVTRVKSNWISPKDSLKAEVRPLPSKLCIVINFMRNESTKIIGCLMRRLC